jgi:hypothetical protein
MLPHVGSIVTNGILVVDCLHVGPIVDCSES